MKQYLAFLLILVVTCQIAFAEPKRLVKAAGYADKTLALYFEAKYIGPVKGINPNLRVEAAKVILVQVSGSREKPKLMEMNCKNDNSILASFQDSPYGRDSEGKVIGLECSPHGQFLFILYREMKNGPGADKRGTCGEHGMLNTKPAALAASFGHQAFCMEDWSAVNDPSAQLETEFNKLPGRK
jgi:hypothetical protein